MSAEKRWVLKPQGDAAKVAALAAALDIPPVLANLLVQRGIETEEEAWQFFNPKLENLHDPFLMKDMETAPFARVDEAVERDEPENHGLRRLRRGRNHRRRAGLHSFLRQMGTRRRCSSTYPTATPKATASRSNLAIDYAQSATGVGLIIALDCGIKADGERSPMPRPARNRLHHLRPPPAGGAPFPAAVAVLDPKRPGLTTIRSTNSPAAALGSNSLQGYCQYKGIAVLGSGVGLLDLVVVSTAVRTSCRSWARTGYWPITASNA